MFSLNTLTHSNVVSTTSSPLDTHRSAEPEQLTPKCKVKAMLAAIDDATDNESTQTLYKPCGGLANEKGEKKLLIEDDRKEDETSVVSAPGVESDTSEEDDVLIPRGKMASRLRGRRHAERIMASSSDEELAGNAYDRIKAQLLRRPIRTVDSPGKPMVHDQAHDAESASNVTRHRRRISKMLNSETERSHTRKSLSCTPSSELFLIPKAMNDSISTINSNAEPWSDSDLPSKSEVNTQFLALVAKKRAERLAIEAAKSKKLAENAAASRQKPKMSTRRARHASIVVSEFESGSDVADGKVLTQQARPTRKASKKALEELNRETQRISRNMQLAHEAKTKKKVTKESLLARFNFKSNPTQPPGDPQAMSSSVAVSSAPVSDLEGARDEQTPPTSPAEHDLSPSKQKEHNMVPHPMAVFEVSEPTFGVDVDLPTMEDVMNQPIKHLDKGKGKATVEDAPGPLNISRQRTKATFTQRPVRVRPSKSSTLSKSPGIDSDSDLEIVAKHERPMKKLDVFDRMPSEKANNVRPLQTLRALAHLTSPSKQTMKVRASLTPADLQVSLQRRARQQAAMERAEKIQDLKNRGIIVQSAKERERDQAEVEDLLEKARRETEELTKKEKDAAKRERKENGEEEGLEDTSDEDEDYLDDDDENDVEAEIQLSGSDDEIAEHADRELNSNEEIDDDDASEDEGGAMAGIEIVAEDLLDDKASEDNVESDMVDSGEEDEPFLGCPEVKRRGRKRVIDEDDEDEENMMNLNQKPSGVRDNLNDTLRPILPAPAEVPMGLTQAFAATMANSQTQADDIKDGDDQEQDSLAFIRGMPGPGLVMVDLVQSQSIIMDSQGDAATSNIDFHLSQSQIHHGSLKATQTLPLSTQYSDIPDPSQDVGFGVSSPITTGRFVSLPPSTADTVLLPVVDSVPLPVLQRKGRLRRRTDAVPVFSDGNEDATMANGEGHDLEDPVNAFSRMKEASQKTALVVDAFDKKKSDAKRMVEEQAEESEDEYAGLGGASDDDSAVEDHEEFQKMIDESDIKVDERKLAAFHADKERSRDEQAVEKLFKDINNGMLRRKRGAEFDLSDSDDDLEARRRRKQRDFAKMRKALLANENVGKIAEDPKKLAFLRAIEDREDDEELDFIDEPEKPLVTIPASQEEEASQPQAVLPEPIPSKRKHPLQPSLPDHANRPQPQARRTQKVKKPSTLAEIRQSVSFLIEEPHAMLPPPLPHSDSADENEDEARELIPESPSSRDSFQNRRRPNAVIDRLSLKRAESASSVSANTRLAFLDSSSISAPGFRVPSLLRRATTQVTGENNYGITTNIGTERTAGGGDGKEGFVKRGGTKRSSVNWWAREEQRLKAVREVEREREQGRRRIRDGRRGMLGDLGIGCFE